MGIVQNRAMVVFLCAAAGILPPALHAGEAFTIPEEKAYTPVKITGFRKGFILDALPDDWEVVSLDGMWKFTDLPAGSDQKNPLEGEGMKQGYYKAAFDDGAWIETTQIGTRCLRM